MLNSVIMLKAEMKSHTVLNNHSVVFLYLHKPREGVKKPKRSNQNIRSTVTMFY